MHILTSIIFPIYGNINIKQLLPECLVGTQRRKHFLFDILFYYLGYTVDLLIYADLHKVDFF